MNSPVTGAEDLALIPSALIPIDTDLLAAVCAAAAASPRLRSNHNLHGLGDLVQRFLNALQPGTYVRPHRHQRQDPAAGFEFVLVLQGSLGLLLLDASGAVIERRVIAAGGPLRGVELATGSYHTLVALEPNTVMFELKQGPYQPASDKDFMAGFPLEGTPEARLQEQAWRAMFS